MTSVCTGAFDDPGRSAAWVSSDPLPITRIPMTLADLKKGDRVVITAIRTAAPSVQRLMIMGLVEGAELECLGGSLGGDPLEYRLFGGAISLRREDGRHFDVRRVSDHG
jgi:Fe2+ transport system protein FeoA